MEVTELRRRLLDYLTRADEKLLREVKFVVENYKNDQVVAHNVQGEPLNRETFQQEISEAEAEYKKGNSSTHKQLQEEIKNWKK